MENPGNKTIFYSASVFPDFTSSNIQFTLPLSHTEEEMEATVHSNASITNTVFSHTFNNTQQPTNHTLSNKDGSDSLNAFTSLFSSKPLETPCVTLPYSDNRRAPLFCSLLSWELLQIWFATWILFLRIWSQ